MMIPEKFSHEAQMLLSFIAEPSVATTAKQQMIERLLAQSFLSGMRRFAWWKDETENVGTCGKTYQKAREEVMTEAKLKGEIGGV